MGSWLSTKMSMLLRDPTATNAFYNDLFTNDEWFVNPEVAAKRAVERIEKKLVYEKIKQDRRAYHIDKLSEETIQENKMLQKSKVKVFIVLKHGYKRNEDSKIVAVYRTRDEADRHAIGLREKLARQKKKNYVSVTRHVLQNAYRYQLKTNHKATIWNTV